MFIHEMTHWRSINDILNFIFSILSNSENTVKKLTTMTKPSDTKRVKYVIWQSWSKMVLTSFIKYIEVNKVLPYYEVRILPTSIHFHLDCHFTWWTLHYILQREKLLYNLLLFYSDSASTFPHVMLRRSSGGPE